MPRHILLLVLLSCVTTWLGHADKDSVDHYKALEISRDSTLKQIRRAYRKLSVKWHPDKHAGKSTLKEAQKRFQAISTAYEVLSDEDKRLLYDDYGDEKFYSREAARAAGHSTDKGFYVNNKNIVELKKWMFNGWTFSGERAKGPLRTKDTWFFEFYAPWCTHCQQMAPAFKRAAARLSDVVGFAAANCENKDGVCQMWNIRSYPTLIFVQQSKEIQEKYEGPHDADSLVTYIREMSVDAVEELTTSNFSDKVYDSTHAWFVLFNAGDWCPPCNRAKPMFRKFAGKIHPHAKTGTINCDAHKALCQEHNINSYPTFMSFTPGGSRAGQPAFGSADVGHSQGLDIVAGTVKLMAAAAKAEAEAKEDAEYETFHEGL